MGIQEGLQLGLRHGALMARQFLAIAEQHQGRQPLHLQSIAAGGIGVSLQLAHLEAIAIGAGGPIHQRRHQAAGAAPGGPHIHQFQSVILHPLGLEVGITEAVDSHWRRHSNRADPRQLAGR